ncbi:MAG: hypothetical protein HLX50_12940 [Alteromonadaceae bacterium]|nr:hypothetical protein [Alteromonadaceae bacterium]
MNNRFLDYLHLHLGKLSETSLKHRRAILLLSLLMFFIGPSVKVTFGKASLAGLGISITPPQEISIGLLVLGLLIYRVFAFWTSIIIESGTDLKLAKRKALLEIEPEWEAEEYEPGNIEQYVRHSSNKIVYKWTKWQLIWEFLFPNIVAITAFITYVMKFSLN